MKQCKIKTITSFFREERILLSNKRIFRQAENFPTG